MLVLEVMKCEFNRSANVFPSVINCEVMSELRKSSSDTANNWIGNSGMFKEKAVNVDREARRFAEYTRMKPIK